MNGGWWCCCGGCTTYEDDFERADSPTIGGSWVDCGSTASIDDGRLKIPSGGKVVLEEMAADVNEEVGIFVAECEVRDASGVHTGTVYKITAFEGSVGTPCGGKTGDYYTVTATIGSTSLGITTVELRLYHSGVQIGTLPQSFGTTAFTFNLVLCVSKDMIVAGEENWMKLWTCPDDEYGTDGRYFSLETSGGTGYIEWAFYTDHYDHDPTCPDCTINCCCPCIEDMEDRSTRTLTATIVASDNGDADGCGAMDGEELTLTCDGVEFECCTWKSATPFEFENICRQAIPAESLDGNTYGLDFEVVCEALYQECEDYVGYLDWAAGYDNFSWCRPTNPGSLEPNLQQINASSVTCDCEVNDVADSMSLTFGPFELWTTGSAPGGYDECYCCEEFYIVVTS
jgi:hypothetical protein